MNNDLFNQNLMKKLASDKELQLTVTRHDLIKNHLSKLENGDFKSETSNYLYFYEIILKEILGYDLQENILFDEKEDTGRGKSEFVLKDGDKKFMVVELKGSDADLDKPQNRANDKRTPVDQAFDYAQHTGDIDWIMVSNYNEFRLYNWHTKGKYISFTFEELLEKDVFSYFMLSFSCYSHISSGYAYKLIQETILVEKKLEKNFYKLFHETRLMLLKEIEENNDTLSREKSIEYAQLILNRYMFICFAEDSDHDLLPSQISTKTLSKPIKDGDIGDVVLWTRLNELFGYINKGNDFKKINGYNGGLFSENLQFLQIRDLIDDKTFFEELWQKWDFVKDYKEIDELIGVHGDRINPIYKNLLIISSFDFQSELDVNILGHVFENSIGDIEELKSDSKGRRKKEGVFYTPEDITDYICKNTIIPYFSKEGDAKSIDDLIFEYSKGHEIEELQQKLMNIKILDPACGSGAFLNKASDILLEIHDAIHDFKKSKNIITIETKGGKGKSRIKKNAKHVKLDPYIAEASARQEILKNNIFGVDLNQESVDITKLALFLKVAQKEKTLPYLDDNIKCGNSLIDDPEFAGDKAFNWEEEFKDIFSQGGFDIVIGNPPYVRQERIKEIKPYLKGNYDVYHGKADLYVYFFEKGLKLLRNNGLFAFICSDKFICSNYGKFLRNLILNYKFCKFMDYKGKGIFEDATVDPCIIVIKKENSEEGNSIFINEEFKIDQNKLNNGCWNFKNPEILDLKDKIENIGIRIIDIPGIDITWGVRTGYNKAFIINQNLKDRFIKEFYPNSRIIKPLIRGKDIKKWTFNYHDIYVILVKYGDGIHLTKDFTSIASHLKKHENALKNRGQVKNGQHHWLELDNHPTNSYLEKFKKPKLIYPEIASELFVAYSENEIYANNKCFIINSDELNLKYFGALLSSKTLNFFFRLIGNPIARTSSSPQERPRYNFSKTYVEQLPIYPATPEEQQPFIEKADQMLEMNKILQNEINSFKDWLTYIFQVEKFSKKLEKYYELSLDEFIDELRKKKVDVKNKDNFTNLKEEFEKSVSKIRPLLQEIEETDNEIDQMVYELYGLTDDEIKIIEDSLSN